MVMLFSNYIYGSKVPYWHILGVCVTYKTAFGFEDRIWPLYNLLQHFINHYLRLDTLDFRPQYTKPLPSLLQLNYWSKVKVTLRLTVSQSVSMSLCRAPWPYFHYCLTVTVLFLSGVLSDERTGLSFAYAAGLASSVFLGSESLGARDYILLSQIWDFPFRRLLRLAESRWIYSPPPPQGISTMEIVSLTVI
jgi:hypothetical protein